jgi:hypothetical protein
MKAEPSIYKGIAFVRVAELPKAQQELIVRSPVRNSLIKILKDKTLMVDCLPYAEYESWFVHEYPRLRTDNHQPDTGFWRSILGPASV